MDTVSGGFGLHCLLVLSAVVWWLLGLFVCVDLHWCGSVCLCTQHIDAVCEQNFERLPFLSVIFFSPRPSLLVFFTVPPLQFSFYPALFDPSPFPSILPSSLASSPQMDRAEYRSDLASPFRSSSPLVRRCSVHPGWKTDGTRRQRETETKRKNQRERQRERRTNGKGNSSCKSLGVIYSCPRLSYSTHWIQLH